MAYSCIKRRGKPRTIVDCGNIISEYNSGKSVKQLAADNGCSRSVICRVLRDAEITPRNRSESMYVRMANTLPEERSRLTAAAHEAKRGYVNSPETRHKMALARNKRVGVFENGFIAALKNAGIPVFPQQPFLAYNFDIGCGNVAVEIEVCHGLIEGNTKFMKRIMECLHAGMNMIYVAITSKRTVIPDACYNQVIALVEACRRNPPAQCQYWVVRSTGELHSTGTFYAY